MPKDIQIWQDPISPDTQSNIDAETVKELKAKILDSGLSAAELVRVAWASAASYRDADMRGGANGARIAVAPQKDWEVNSCCQSQMLAGMSGRTCQIRIGSPACGQGYNLPATCPQHIVMLAQMSLSFQRQRRLHRAHAG